MGVKLDKKSFPNGHSQSDFKCFGPPATKDGEFENVKICDLGCFTQTESGGQSDSNKYYHGAVIQSTKTSKWYAYFEWGRTGRANPDFQFVECHSESDAQDEFAAQLHSKNDKRGMWATVAGIKTLKAKPGKDCYLVRPQAVRSTGLPDARTIQSNDGAKVTAAPSVTTSPTKPSTDRQTLDLLRDLNLATVAYTKGAMADASIPTQTSIEDARTILGEAVKVIGKIGDNLTKQVANKDLLSFSNLLYSRIPKIKPVGGSASDWILSQDNIQRWNSDLDAFEQALYTTCAGTSQSDPLDGFGLEMSWLDPKSEEGKLIISWIVKSDEGNTYKKKIKVSNIWKTKRPTHLSRYTLEAEKVAKEVNGKSKHLPKGQPDNLTSLEKLAGIGKLYHSTRSCNVSGILRTGLRLPKELKGITLTGSLLGSGNYFGSMSKASQYSSSRSAYWSSGSGSVSGRQAFMFLASVIVGQAHLAPKTHPYIAPPTGFHSVYGKAGHTNCGGTWGTLKNDEFVTYEPQMHHLDYLFEFSE